MAHSEYVLECDAIIPAIGQEPEAECLIDCGVSVGRRNTVTVNHATMQTSAPDVFAAGDAVSGPATVIDAVAAGHRAADAIHRYLTGEDMELVAAEMAREIEQAQGDDWRDIPEGIIEESRALLMHRAAESSVGNFEEVALGLADEDSQQEALRCLNCGVCSECMECVRACERASIDHGMREETTEVKVGTIILATGFDIMDPAPMKPYGYGRFQEVYTGLEFERLNNAVGPTGGQIVTKDGRKPESIAIIHCVGSRDVNHHEYCSRVCCMYALKYGHLIKEKVGHDTKVYNFYIDMRCFGKGYEEFYRRLQDEGVTFVRGRPGEITDHALTPQEEGKLIVVSEDTLLGRRMRFPVDMVVLCTAMEARKEAPEVARIFGISQGGTDSSWKSTRSLDPFPQPPTAYSWPEPARAPRTFRMPFPTHRGRQPRPLPWLPLEEWRSPRPSPGSIPRFARDARRASSSAPIRLSNSMSAAGFPSSTRRCARGAAVAQAFARAGPPR